MKIRTKLLLNALITVVFTVALGIAFSLMTGKLEDADAKERAVQNVVGKLFELRTVTFEYLLHKEDRMVVEWRRKHASAAADLGRLGTSDMWSRDTFSRLAEDLKALDFIFSQLTIKGTSAGKQELLGGQILLKTERIMTTLLSLVTESREQETSVQNKMGLLVTGMTLMLLVAVSTLSMTLGRNIMRSLKDLKKGAEIIGSGNFDHRTAMQTGDEIGALSLAFDRMAESLKTADDEQRRKEKALQESEQEILKLNAELEQRVRERTAQLEAANRELESFSYSVSHDLRAPLRYLTSFVELLNRRCPNVMDEKGRHYLAAIDDSAKQMGQLIDDLLAFSRMGRAEMVKTKVSLERLAAEAVETLETETRERDIVWKIAPLPEVYADLSMLRLVLVNLISNAIKYTRPRPQAIIEIGCMEDREDEAVFFVKDNGVGFDMKYAHKLFGLFQRLHRDEEFEGTGVGLANVSRIIARHGGRTWAEGSKDGGAAFYFSIPKIKEG